MKAAEFKKAISEAKESLKGKTLRIDFVNGSKIERLTFSSLRAFGNAVLQLEAKGAGFGFIKVGNDFTQKGIYKPSQFTEVLNRGVWKEVFFLATTVKI
ncbi:hypothetical protein RM545_06480 [Zunongwangia sp. F260]|uniref:Uncharacterized protein n=1 Tax=Autumnicola lenta TaxID=3075593 RepID=A0ABU3CJ39_9FLAO|nr:hypothetical protein [Zunongwangia sp. F260]MDT0646331.1 hypothetical protein [Zunongwangia sp. F260]